MGNIADDADEHYEWALSTLITVRALRCCRDHEDCIIQGPEEVSEAYKVASKQWKREGFQNQREATDLIQEIHGESPDQCPRCDAIRYA